MRSLNGQNYSVLFIAKPVKREVVSQNISELISVRDKAFGVSKRNIARSNSFSETQTKTQNENDTKNSTAGQLGSGAGISPTQAASRLGVRMTNTYTTLTDPQNQPPVRVKSG